MATQSGRSAEGTGQTNASQEAAGTGKPAVFVSRMPVYDRNKEVWGHQIRLSSGIGAAGADGAKAPSLSEVIIHALQELNLPAMVGDARIIIPITRELVEENAHTLLPRENTTFELSLEQMSDDDAAAACRRLSDARYGVALSGDPRRIVGSTAFADVDLIEIESETLGSDALRDIPTALRPRTLVQSIESPSELARAMESGCQYLHGCVFAHPEPIKGARVRGFRPVHLEMLRIVNCPEVDYAQLESVIRRDVALSAGLLRMINNASRALRHKVTRFREAFVMLGERNLRRWAAVAALREVSDEAPDEAIRACLVRARFCEAMAAGEGVPQHGMDLFTVGLFSGLDAVLGLSLEEALARVGAPDIVADAILRQQSSPPLIARIHKLCMACERADWGEVTATTAGLRQFQGEIATLYYDSLNWATQALEA
ncbi:MAG: HDOD domain-containing protein [Planctomycetota bacterium]|nr:HDOD domain-containing protein [Planctomycetota bacterium]